MARREPFGDDRARFAYEETSCARDGNQLAIEASGVAGLAFHITKFRSGNKLDYLLVSLIRGLAIVAGGFMLRGRNWARWLPMVWILFHIVVSAFHPIGELAIHILVFGVFAFVLFRSDAGAYFGKSETP